MIELQDLLRLATYAYTDRERTGSLERVDGHACPWRGFEASVWRDSRSDEHVVAVRGTQGLRDAYQDVLLLSGRDPSGWRAGEELLERLEVRRPPGARLYLTGHSIGGAFAANLAAKHGIPAVTFNAPGTLYALRRHFAGRALPRWVHEQHTELVDISIGRDWIRQLSGPVLGARVLVGNTPVELDGWGPAEMVRELRRGFREQGPSFVRRSLRRHAVTAFRDFLVDEDIPWSRPVTWALPGLRELASAGPQKRRRARRWATTVIM